MVARSDKWLSPSFMIMNDSCDILLENLSTFESFISSANMVATSPHFLDDYAGLTFSIGTLIIPAAYLPLPNFEIVLRSMVWCSDNGGIISTVDGRGFTSNKRVELISTEKYS